MFERTEAEPEYTSILGGLACGRLTRLTPGNFPLPWRKAAQWIEAVVGCDTAEAQMKLGQMLLAGDGIGPDARAAFACFLCAGKAAMRAATPCWAIAWKMAGAPKRILPLPSRIIAGRRPLAMPVR